MRRKMINEQERCYLRTNNRNFFDALPSAEDGVPPGALRFLEVSILRHEI